ncbi:MAG: hypothetical protein ABFS56_29490 [Pseudomonadota bacterium]
MKYGCFDALHGELTIVVIAHRLSTVRHADKKAVMENGQIVEIGNNWKPVKGAVTRFMERQ